MVDRKRLLAWFIAVRLTAVMSAGVVVVGGRVSDAARFVTWPVVGFTESDVQTVAVEFERPPNLCVLWAVIPGFRITHHRAVQRGRGRLRRAAARTKRQYAVSRAEGGGLHTVELARTVVPHAGAVGPGIDFHALTQSTDLDQMPGQLQIPPPTRKTSRDDRTSPSPLRVQLFCPSAVASPPTCCTTTAVTTRPSPASPGVSTKPPWG